MVSIIKTLWNNNKIQQSTMKHESDCLAMSYASFTQPTTSLARPLSGKSSPKYMILPVMRK